jgi:nucleotide-binding universal stress UspA family protein
MSYKTILVHLDDSPQAAARTACALELAHRFGAWLIGAAPTGVSRQLAHSIPDQGRDATLALHLAFVREKAELALAAFETQMAAAGCSDCSALLVDDEAAEGISLHARAADLAVLSQSEPQHATSLLGQDFAADVVIQAGRPVLVLPCKGPTSAPGTRVLVCWNGGKEAARAMAAALPFLQGAVAVTVAVFDSGGNSATLDQAAAAHPLPWLLRHGVRASYELRQVPPRGGLQRRHAVGEAVLALAAELGADLLVMGAYGHSRFRETILGGATRTVFDAMHLPVLMAH